MTLSFEEFNKQLNSDTIKDCILTNYTEMLADLDTPVSIYAKLKSSSDDAFLFESILGGEKIGRYSFIGYKALDIVTDSVRPYSRLESEIDKVNHQAILPFFHTGFVGYLSFESIAEIEPSLKLKTSPYPLGYFILVGSLVVFDHVKQKIFIISNQLIKDRSQVKEAYQNSLTEIEELKKLINTASKLNRLDFDFKKAKAQDTGFKSNTDNFKEMVIKAKEHIREGDIFQVVLSHRLEKDLQIDPLTAYRILRTINPSPYLFIYNFKLNKKTISLVGSSPEMIVKSTIQADGSLEAEIRPIAGTYKRGTTEAEDIKLAAELIKDPKESSEHIMLVDLARNDLGRVCENGSVTVPHNMIVERYSHVLHIVSSVTGLVKNTYGNKAGVELLKACFPAGTLSGAPKVEAINIISSLEKEARGLYGGAIGYFGLDGMVDTAIMIRTLIIEENKVSVQAGAGVVADSEPEKELQETYNKASALMQVVNWGS